MTQDSKGMSNTYRQQLNYISQQKQQLQFQKNILNSTVKELESTKEDKVFKGVGNVFIKADKSKVLKETKDNIETVDLKLKNIEKQESDIVKKLNDLNKSTSSNKNTKSNDSKQNNVEGVA